MLEDWPLTSAQLVAYCKEKYTNIDATHHWRVIGSDVIGVSDTDRVFLETRYGGQYVLPVTNWDHENEENEKKRKIKVIKSYYIGSFVENFEKNLIR